MSTQRKHLSINGYVVAEKYRSKTSARGTKVAKQDREKHGQKLQQQYQQALNHYEQVISPRNNAGKIPCAIAYW